MAEFYVVPGSSMWLTAIPVRRDDGVLGLQWTDERTGDQWFEWYENDAR